MLNYLDIARRYTPNRTAGLELNTALMEHLPRGAVEQAARQLGMWVKGRVVLRDEDQSSVLMDFAIYDCREEGRNALDRYLAAHPPAPGSQRAEILAAIQRSYYSLFLVEQVVPGAGVHVYDIIQKQRRFLADIGFSQTAIKGIVLATRVFDFGDYIMTGGAALVPGADTMEEIVEIMCQPENRDVLAMDHTRRAALNATLIGLCLNSPDAPKMRYQTVGEDAMEPAECAEPAVSSRRTGRNEPCPCGSGRKFKKCCGK